MSRAACTYSRSRSTIVWARTVRAYCTHAEIEIASTITSIGPTSRHADGSICRATAVTRMAISIVGMDSSTSPTHLP
nr:hypothetical protein [Sinirhodobacter populi]